LNHAPPTAVTGSRRTAITAALLLGTFLASIEVTVVATAMPSIAEQLGGLALYPWVYSAYLLAQTVSIPLYGRLADLYGRRVIYVGGVGLFLVGSLLCGLAPSMELLVAARALQGLGAGAVLPLTMTIFGDLYEVEARTKLQGAFSLVWGVSSVIGPLAGGVIVSQWTWPWVFWINLPFGVVSLAVVGALLREGGFRREHRLDLAGAALLSCATVSLLVALLPPEQRPMGLHPAIWIGLSAAAVAALLRQEGRHPEPLVPLDLFGDRVQLAANASGLLLGVILFGVVSYVPLYVQAVRGGGPILAGSVLIPLSLSWTVSTFVCGRLVLRVGFRTLVRCGCSLVAAGGVVGALGVAVDVPTVSIAGEMLYGFGMGATISSFTVSVQERVPPQRRGIATALTQFSRTIGGAVGVAALGAVLTHRVGPGLSSVDFQEIDPVLRAAFDSGLTTVFWLMAVSAVTAAVLGIGLYPAVRDGEPAANGVRS